MASEFGVLLTDKVEGDALEKTNCEVILTRSGRVRRREVDGVKGYEWEFTDHRLGLCEIEHTMSMADFFYNQIKYEGAYPIFPHYITDVLKYGKMVDRNDHQIRVDRDVKELSKILIQPYFGEAYFSPEFYTSTFLKRQAIQMNVEMLRAFVPKRVAFYEDDMRRSGAINGNWIGALQAWKEKADLQMSREGNSQTNCVDHNADVIYQHMKKLRFGLLYPHYYMLNSEYTVEEKSKGGLIANWLVKEKAAGRAENSPMYSGVGPLNTLRERIERDELDEKVIQEIIAYGSKFSTYAGTRTGDLTLNELVKYCESLTTFVHKKKKEGEDETAREFFKSKWIQGMPKMNFENEMIMSRKSWANTKFFWSIDMFKRNNGVDIDPNGKNWKDYKKKIQEQLDEAQKKNNNEPYKVMVDGVNIMTNKKYGSVENWVDWVVNYIMLSHVKRLVKDYKFKRLKPDNLMSGMNKLVGALRCYAYCLILALYDYFGEDIEGFKKGTNAASIVETVSQMFPQFRKEVSETFGITLNTKDVKYELFIARDMSAKEAQSGEVGYKFQYGWRKTDQKVMSDYADILSEKVEALYQALLSGRKWSDIADDTEEYFIDDLYVNKPDRVFERAGLDPERHIKVKGAMNELTTYFSKRFVSYWYKITKVEARDLLTLADIGGDAKKYTQFDPDDFKPMAVAELGAHASTYVYQNLILGRNRGEKIDDAKEIVWYDLSLTNFGCSRSLDSCWVGSVARSELNLRFHLISAIFERYQHDARRSSFYEIIFDLPSKKERIFPSYKHYYVALLQNIFNDTQRLEVMDYCERLMNPETRMSALLSLQGFKNCVESEFVAPTLKMNALLWVLADMENIDINYSNKRMPLLLSTEKGLRVISIDMFNGMLGVSYSGWIPYLERICSEVNLQRRLRADELKLKKWFISYYATHKVERRAEPRMSFKMEGISTWIGSNCGGVQDYVLHLIPSRKPKPGLLFLIYADDGDVDWVANMLSDVIGSEGSLGFIFINDRTFVNKSQLKVRTLKIYNRGMLDRLILISGGNYTFGNKFLLSKLLAKTEK
ncbi:VP2 [Orbivirus alphaequi]|uniref:Outer capsid protein VP2 n=1 Tax=African horse sickness virus TaxID=40050 RepID=A0A0D4L4K5_AHSV|nr:VP2 [African horse sickness virus]